MTHPDAVAEAVTELLFSRFRTGDGWRENWCCAYDNSVWHTKEFPEVYINGIMACVDFDYEGAYLLMVCDSSTEANLTRYLAVAHAHGLKDGVLSEWGPWEHPFFGRNVNPFDVIGWFTEWYRRVDQEANGPHVTR